MRADLLGLSSPFTRASYNGGERYGCKEDAVEAPERSGPPSAAAFSHASLMASAPALLKSARGAQG